jgi:hypothetical protein
MAQSAVPISDVPGSVIGWTPTPVSAQIVTPAPPDVTFVSSVANPFQSTFEVNLSPVAWPSFGTQSVQVRLRSTTSNPINVGVTLFQGTRSIASWIVPTTAVFTTYLLQLKQTQSLLITDYTQLRLQVTAGVQVSSSSSSTCMTNLCCGAACLPDTLHCSIPGASGTCSCLVGSYTMEIGTAPVSWFVLIDACGGNPMELSLLCSEGVWSFVITCEEHFTMFNSPSFQSCSPFQLGFALTGSIPPCCSGTVSVIITG